MKRKRHTIVVTVTTKPGVTTARAVKEVRDALKANVDTFYFADTDMRVSAVRSVTRQLEIIGKVQS